MCVAETIIPVAGLVLVREPGWRFLYQSLLSLPTNRLTVEPNGLKNVFALHTINTKKMKNKREEIPGQFRGLRHDGASWWSTNTPGGSGKRNILRKISCLDHRPPNPPPWTHSRLKLPQNERHCRMIHPNDRQSICAAVNSND